MNLSNAMNVVLRKFLFYTIAFASLFNPDILCSQDYIQITGKVVDSATHQPLSYSTIKIVIESIK